MHLSFLSLNKLLILHIFLFPKHTPYPSHLSSLAVAVGERAVRQPLVRWVRSCECATASCAAEGSCKEVPRRIHQQFLAAWCW
jgi:hypothetical protein